MYGMGAASAAVGAATSSTSRRHPAGPIRATRASTSCATASNLQEQMKGAARRQQAGIQAASTRCRAASGPASGPASGRGAVRAAAGAGRSGADATAGRRTGLLTAARMRNAQPMPMGGGMNFGGMPWGMPNMGGYGTGCSRRWQLQNPQGGRTRWRRHRTPVHSRSRLGRAARRSRTTRAVSSTRSSATRARERRQRQHLQAERQRRAGRSTTTTRPPDGSR